MKLDWRGALGIAISAALLWWVLHGIPFHEVSATLRGANLPLFLLSSAVATTVFPLRARKDGVLERRGQTEAAVDLARLAGLSPSGVICEIVSEDGTMARLPDLIRFCGKHDFRLVSVADLAQHRCELTELEMVL